MMLHRFRTGLIAVLLAITPMLATAHTRPRPNPDNVWAAWYVDPVVAVSMLIGSWLYLRGVRNLWDTAGHGKVISTGQRNAWYWAMFSLVVALFSPLDALGGALFSAHMVQHLILFVVTPWLLAYARPGLGIWWGLPATLRKRIGGSVGTHPVVRRAHGASRNPTLIVIAFTAVLWLWHTPALYNAALRSDFIHAVEHFSFMAGAYLLWSWLISVQHSRGGPNSDRQGIAILIVFITVMQSGVLGAILTFARTPLYEMHAGYTDLWGLSLLQDQQIAGLLMWVPMGLTFTLVALLLFRSWLIASERRAREREQAEARVSGTPATEVQS